MQPPAAEETEDHAADASLERELSAGVAGQDTVIQAANAKETEPTADGTNSDADGCVIIEAQVIAGTPLKQFPGVEVGRGDNPVKW